MVWLTLAMYAASWPDDVTMAEPLRFLDTRPVSRPKWTVDERSLTESQAYTGMSPSSPGGACASATATADEEPHRDRCHQRDLLSAMPSGPVGCPLVTSAWRTHSPGGAPARYESGKGRAMRQRVPRRAPAANVPAPTVSKRKTVVPLPARGRLGKGLSAMGLGWPASREILVGAGQGTRGEGRHAALDTGTE